MQQRNGHFMKILRKDNRHLKAQELLAQEFSFIENTFLD